MKLSPHGVKYCLEILYVRCLEPLTKLFDMQSYTVHTCARAYIVRACKYVYNTEGPRNLMLSGHANY